MIPRAWPATLLACALAASCGDDATGGPDDGGTRDDGSLPDGGSLDDAGPPAPCLHVDGRGGLDADGTAARPFATLDDALAAAGAAAPGELCLEAGEHAPPTRAIPGGWTVRGPAAERPEDRAAIRGAVGPCLLVEGLDLGDPEAPLGDVMTALLVEGDAPATLVDLDVRDCDVGVTARGAGGVVLQRVGIDRVIGGVAIDAGSSGTLQDVTVEHGFRVRALGTEALPAGISAGAGATIALTGVSFTASRVPAFGIVARRSDVTLADSTLRGHSSWLVIQDNATHSTTLRRSALLDQSADPLDGHALSTVQGGRLDAEALELGGSDERGLQLVDLDATLTDLVARGVTRAAVAAYGGSVRLEGTTRLELPGERSVGLLASSSPSGGVATVTLGAALDSTATPAGGIHLVALSGGAVEITTPVTLRGGSIGLAADGGGRIASSAAVVVEAPSLAGAAGATEGTVLDLRGLDVRLGGDSGGGVLATDGARVQLDDVTSQGGLFGVLCTDCGGLDARGLAVAGAGYGVVLDGAGGAGEQRLESPLLQDNRGPGVLVLGAWQATVLGGEISDNAGPGIEAQDGAELRIDGVHLGGNGGAGAAFYDAAGVVVHSTFMASVPVALDATGVLRADEIRVVSTGGATREVFVGDDGDRVIDAGEENAFVILGSRVCDGGGCSLVFADGPGAVGIVTPNCLTTDAGAVTTRSIVEQAGARLEFAGTTRDFWAAQLAGIGVDLGLFAGVATSTAPLAGLAGPDLSGLDVPEPAL